MKAVSALLCIWILQGCEFPLDPSRAHSANEVDDGSGALFKDALVEAILGGDRIVVTEHAWTYDAETASVEARNQQVYRTHELSAAEKDWFQLSIHALDPRLDSGYTACFSPHHALKFYRDGRLLSTMEVCFECQNVNWDAAKGSQPTALIPILSRLITNIGLEPRRDWRALEKTASR